MKKIVTFILAVVVCFYSTTHVSAQKLSKKNKNNKKAYLFITAQTNRQLIIKHYEIVEQKTLGTPSISTRTLQPGQTAINLNDATTLSIVSINGEQITVIVHEDLSQRCHLLMSPFKGIVSKSIDYNTFDSPHSSVWIEPSRETTAMDNELPLPDKIFDIDGEITEKIPRFNSFSYLVEEFKKKRVKQLMRHNTNIHIPSIDMTLITNSNGQVYLVNNQKDKSHPIQVNNDTPLNLEKNEVLNIQTQESCSLRIEYDKNNQPRLKVKF